MLAANPYLANCLLQVSLPVRQQRCIVTQLKDVASCLHACSEAAGSLAEHVHEKSAGQRTPSMPISLLAQLQASSLTQHMHGAQQWQAA
jgi:hypothetical protein